MKASLDHVSLTLSRAFSKISCIFLLLLLAVTVANVMARYLFHRPIAGAYELTEFIMALICITAFAHAAQRKSHVAVSIMTSRLQEATRTTLETLQGLIVLILSLMFTWKTLSYAHDLQSAGQFSGALQIPIAPFVYLLALGFALMSLVYGHQFLSSLLKTLSGSARNKAGLALGLVLAFVFVAFFIWGKELPLRLSPTSMGLACILLLLALLFSGIPVGFAMILVGFLGIAYLRNLTAAFDIISRVPYGTISSYGLSVAPLFMLMGQLAFHAGLTEKLYESVYKWIGNLPGGLAMATIGACTGFAAITGSSLATAATMGSVAYPEMKKYQYHPKLSTGCIASGGPIAAMIPPSILFILYAISTEQSIGHLFIAGIVPGIIICFIYMLTIYVQAKMNPGLGPRGPKTLFREKVISLKDTWMIVALFLVIIGGIYSGVFTAIEAGGVGAFGALVCLFLKKRFVWKNFSEALMEVTSLTSMLFIIVIGANIFGYLLAASRLPYIMADVARSLSIPAYAVMIIIMVLYLVLGTFLDSIAMVLLTVPIFFPLVTTLGYDPIWFGVIVVLACETGLITPPVGMTVYVLAAVVKEVPTTTIFKGCMPFVAANIIIMLFFLAFPKFVTFFPHLLGY